MANQIDDYVLCNDSSSLADAVAAVKSASVVVLDCEGKDLGAKGGTLSLISLQALEPETSRTYLLDAISLTKDQLNPIFNMLQSSSVTKIVFDGRMDFSELHHGYSIYLRGVLDLQLADVDSRHQRGEDDKKQLSRLVPFLHFREISGQPGSYSAVHKLCGLEQCIREHEIITGELEQCKTISHRDWLSRPLSGPYLQYSSQDIYLISLLYAHFRREGYIGDQLSAQSARYISLWQDAKPAETDEFKRHPLLPLQILDYNPFSQTRSCNSCKRALPEAAYSKAGWRLTKKRQCWVCRAVSVRKEMHNNWDKDEDDY